MKLLYLNLETKIRSKLKFYIILFKPQKKVYPNETKKEIIGPFRIIWNDLPHDSFPVSGPWKGLYQSVKSLNPFFGCFEAIYPLYPLVDPKKNLTRWEMISRMFSLDVPSLVRYLSPAPCKKGLLSFLLSLLYLDSDNVWKYISDEE